MKQVPEINEKQPALQNINEVDSMDEDENLSNYRPRNSSKRPTFSNSLANLHERNIEERRNHESKISETYRKERREYDERRNQGRERFDRRNYVGDQLRPDSDGGLSSVNENESEMYGSRMISRSRNRNQGIKRSRYFANQIYYISKKIIQILCCIK